MIKYMGKHILTRIKLVLNRCLQAIRSEHTYIVHLDRLKPKEEALIVKMEQYINVLTTQGLIVLNVFPPTR
jgi:hypothetical protein